MPQTPERRRQRMAVMKVEDPERYEAFLASERDRKERYRGSCTDCGAKTSGGNGRGPKAPKRCPGCAKIATGLARRGKGPTLDRIVAFVARREVARYMEIRDEVLDGNGGLAANDVHRLVRSGRLVRVGHGRYSVADAERKR